MASLLVDSLLYIIHTLVFLFYRVYNLSVKDWLQPVSTGFITVFKCFQSKLTSNQSAVLVTYYPQKLGLDLKTLLLAVMVALVFSVQWLQLQLIEYLLKTD